MGRWSKRLKKYERQLLLGLVILLLVSFSVTGAFSCERFQDGGAKEWGGNFLVGPARRMELDGNEFIDRYNRYSAFVNNVGTPSLRFYPGAWRLPVLRGVPGAWAHVVPVEAARAVGYRCGEDYQLKTAIRAAVQGAFGGLEFTNATYDRFLREYYRRGAKEFQESIREVILKDQFLRPLIETRRYAMSYAEAYETWKRLLLRVNLGYVALAGEAFTLPALRQERTRERIGRQEKLLQQVVATARRLGALEAQLAAWQRVRGQTAETVETLGALAERLEAWRAEHDGAWPTRLAELGDQDEAPRDAWGTAIRYERGDEAPRLSSAGPDRRFGTDDDVSPETAVGERAWPAQLEEVLRDEAASVPQDAWMQDLRYVPAEDSYDLRSAGPDGAFESSDDVTLDTLAQLKTHAALRALGDALLAWHRDRGSAGEKTAATVSALEALRGRLESWRDEHEGRWPERLEDLVADEGSEAFLDAWGNAIRYEPVEEDVRLASAGPDGRFDTPDDVSADTPVDAAPWPASLEALTTPPAEGTPPAFRGSTEDAWGQALVYERRPDGAPHLQAIGPDGAPDTEDDVLAFVGDDAVRVPPGAQLIPFLLDEDLDAWDRPFRVDLADRTTWRWAVASAGEDGAFGTEDDLTTGNEAEVRTFFRPIRGEFLEPARRRLEAVYVHLPLVPDEALARLWEAHPEWRPDERRAFDRWRELEADVYYLAEDPADAEAGHGVDLARRLAPDHVPTLVPDVATFGPPPAELTDEDDPDARAYLEKGWRPVLLREMFFDKLLEDLLIKARESQAAVRAWEEAKEAADAAGDAGEDPGPRPDELTFEGLLRTMVGDLVPDEGAAPWIGHYRTDRPLERQEWEALDHIGDVNLTYNMMSVNGPGEYDLKVLVFHDSHTRAVLRNLEYLSERQKELEEVYDEVFDRFLAGKRLALAEAALGKLRREVDQAVAAARSAPAEGESEAETEGEAGTEGEEAPAEVPDPWPGALERWAADVGVPYVEGETGVFVGARPPRSLEAPDDLSDADRLAWKRRDFVRQTGFETIRAAAPTGEEVPAPGALGQRLLKDEGADGTDSVFLVRLLDATPPPPEAFSPRDYADFLASEYLGLPKGGPGLGAASGGERGAGHLRATLQSFFADVDWLLSRYELRTPKDLKSVR